MGKGFNLAVDFRIVAEMTKNCGSGKFGMAE